MNNSDPLINLILAPYIIKALDLISVPRHTGGNQFRHAFMTLGILLDYKYFSDPVLLKAALLHDLLEDMPWTRVDDINCIDTDGNKVVDLVMEVTKNPGEKKAVYLQRVLEHGSVNAKTLKIADRISNLTDLHRDLYAKEKFSKYLDETEEFVIPMAEQVNHDMVIELRDLIIKRRQILSLEDPAVT
jgi:GTP pyrophosphokinase